MEKAIAHTWFFDAAPALVWAYLTESDLLAQWLMKNDFKPVVGHEFQFTTKPRIGFDGTVYCKVLQVVPHKYLEYSWQGGPEKGKITLDSIVSWTLTPKNNGTELQLRHSGFKGIRNYLAYIVMDKGWCGPIHKRLLSLLNAAHETRDN